MSTLTTFDPDGNAHVHEAELIEEADPGAGEGYKVKSRLVVGTYSMPFTVILRGVYVQ